MGAKYSCQCNRLSIVSAALGSFNFLTFTILCIIFVTTSMAVKVVSD